MFPRNVTVEGASTVKVFLVHGYDDQVPALAKTLASLHFSYISNRSELRAFTDAVRIEADSHGPDFASLLYLNAAGAVVDMAGVPYQTRIIEAQKLANMAIGLRDNVPPALELAALEMYDLAWSNEAPGAPDWSRRRSESLDAWLHCWGRLSAVSDSIDGESPIATRTMSSYKATPEGVGLSGVSPQSLPDGPVKEKYVRDLELLRQRNHHEQLEEAVLNDAKFSMKRTERFIVNSYSRPPFDSEALVSGISQHLGVEHPAIRRITKKLGEVLPELERIKLEVLVEKLPPAASAEEMRQARRIAADSGNSFQAQSTAPLAGRANGKAPSTMARGKAKAFTNLQAKLENQSKVKKLGGLAAASSDSRTWFMAWASLAAASGTLIFLVLWRAQSRRQ